MVKGLITFLKSSGTVLAWHIIFFCRQSSKARKHLKSKMQPRNYQIDYFKNRANHYIQKLVFRAPAPLNAFPVPHPPLPFLCLWKNLFGMNRISLKVYWNIFFPTVWEYCTSSSFTGNFIRIVTCDCRFENNTGFQILTV